MKKKGFTLVEMLGVMAILAILIIIALPTYQFVMKRIHQNMYENKIKYILTSAEAWANETTYDVVNVNHLIQSGKLEADNEQGDMINPLTNESMLCDVVRIDHDNFQYTARMTEEKNCSFDDLLEQNSIIVLKKYKENGQELKKNEWYQGTVTLKVEFVDKKWEELATRLQIKGNGQQIDLPIHDDFSTKNTLTVSANQILKTTYEANVMVKENEILKEYKARTEVLIDRQRPTVYMDEVNIGNENEWISKQKEITFTMSDGSGSGVYGYTLTTSNRCGSVGPTKTNKQKVSVSKPNGTYYICVRDNAGNWSEDISTKKVVVSKIDTTPPTIDANTGFIIQSTTSNYNHYKTNLKIIASDESTMSMYLSNTGFEQNGTWERYVSNKEWNVSSSFDGLAHYVYLTLRDEAGNKTNIRSKVYRVYLECSKTTRYSVGDWGACNVSCGGGYQYRTFEYRDNYSNKVCSSGSDQRVCNTHACEYPNDYDWSKDLTCSTTKLTEIIENGKFKEYLEYQEFREAMYDCADSVEDVIRSNPKAIEDLRNSSRYELTITKGRHSSKTCKETCPSNCDKDCKFPPPCADWDWYANAIRTVYTGKVLIISVSAYGRPCFGDASRCNEYCEKDGSCSWVSSSSDISHDGYIILGQPDGRDYYSATWYTVKSDYVKGDADTVIKFFNGFGATVVGMYQNYSIKDNSCKSDLRTIWRDDHIAVQYFKVT